jgi:hypothetical protein
MILRHFGANSAGTFKTSCSCNKQVGRQHQPRFFVGLVRALLECARAAQILHQVNRSAENPVESAAKMFELFGDSAATWCKLHRSVQGTMQLQQKLWNHSAGEAGDKWESGTSLIFSWD